MLSIAPAILSYIPAQTSKKSADYIVSEGTFVECCQDSLQYSYKVNTWANTMWDDRSDFTPGNDYYNAQKTLRIALTEYGEFAGNNTANTLHTGIAYGTGNTEWENTESWASELVIDRKWFQGWMFWANYTLWQEFNRQVLAYAVYSNGTQTEEGRGVFDWEGTMKSNQAGNDIMTGTLTPDGVKILYDSARLGVYRATVTIWDPFIGENFAKITFTVIHDKCNKLVTVYKDLKFLFTKGVELLDFSFSERYELDLAAKFQNTPIATAYMHYFDWQELQSDGLGSSVYYHPELGTNSYDIFQAYTPNHNYIFAAAYWPNCTEFDVRNGTLCPSIKGGVTTLLDDGWRQADTVAGEPNEATLPLVIVQWRYNSTQYPLLINFLTSQTNREIRFVELLTMTDYNLTDPHKAMDWNDTSTAGVNQVATEVAYVFDHLVFNPEDLNSANFRAWTPEQDTPYQSAEDNGPFMYTAVGVNANVVDDAAAEFLSPNYNGTKYSAFPILDMAYAGGTIPYALDESPIEGNGYLWEWNAVTAGVGLDTTTYYYTAMKHFVFDMYGGVYKPPQPIKGGFTTIGNYWYPSINPLSERWTYYSWAQSPYDSVNFDPNGIATAGGPKANWVTRYFNDYMYAITREGDDMGPYQWYAWVNGENPVGTAPTSDPTMTTLDFFPLSSWGTSQETFNYQAGYAVIALGRDEGGLRGLAVYGWNAEDTYWASEWAAKMVLGAKGGQWPAGTVAIILHIDYWTDEYGVVMTNAEPYGFTVVKMLGTITEFGNNYYLDVSPVYDWDHGPYAGVARDAWYSPTLSPCDDPTHTVGTYSLGHWNMPSLVQDVWWAVKYPTCDNSTITFDP